MTNFNILHIGKILFWACFIAGNIALFGYLITRDEYFAAGGFFLLIFGGILNILVFIGLLLYGIFNKDHYQDCVKSALILLINIPVALLYAVIGVSIN